MRRRPACCQPRPCWSVAACRSGSPAPTAAESAVSEKSTGGALERRVAEALAEAGALARPAVRRRPRRERERLDAVLQGKRPGRDGEETRRSIRHVVPDHVAADLGVAGIEGVGLPVRVPVLRGDELERLHAEALPAGRNAVDRGDGRTFVVTRAPRLRAGTAVEPDAAGVLTRAVCPAAVRVARALAGADIRWAQNVVVERDRAERGHLGVGVGALLETVADAGIVAEDDVLRPRAVQAGAVVPVGDVRLHDERTASRHLTRTAGIGLVRAVSGDSGSRRTEAVRHVEDHRVALGLAVVPGLVAVAATGADGAVGAAPALAVGVGDAGAAHSIAAHAVGARVAAAPRARAVDAGVRTDLGQAPRRGVVLAAGDDVPPHDVGAVQRPACLPEVHAAREAVRVIVVDPVVLDGDAVGLLREDHVRVVGQLAALQRDLRRGSRMPAELDGVVRQARGDAARRGRPVGRRVQTLVPMVPVGEPEAAHGDEVLARTELDVAVADAFDAVAVTAPRRAAAVGVGRAGSVLRPCLRRRVAGAVVRPEPADRGEAQADPLAADEVVGAAAVEGAVGRTAIWARRLDRYGFAGIGGVPDVVRR